MPAPEVNTYIKEMDHVASNKTYANIQYDRFLASIFSLGMTILNAATLNSSFDCYDFINFKIFDRKVIKFKR